MLLVMDPGRLVCRVPKSRWITWDTFPADAAPVSMCVLHFWKFAKNYLPATNGPMGEGFYHQLDVWEYRDMVLRIYTV